MYRIERQDQLYITLPRALLFSPTIVVFSALTLFLPLAGVFPPGSLTVTTKDPTSFGHCIIPTHIGMIPTGNLSVRSSPDSFDLFTIDLVGRWNGVTDMAKTLPMQWLGERRVPDLPQVCGSNCTYKVDVPSFVFQCTPNPSSLPYGQAGNAIYGQTLWNGTTMYPDSAFLWNETTRTYPDSALGFYIAWKSNAPNGTWGNAFCLPFQAQYAVEVRIIALSTSLSLILLNFNSRSR